MLPVKSAGASPPPKCSKEKESFSGTKGIACPTGVGSGVGLSSTTCGAVVVGTGMSKVVVGGRGIVVVGGVGLSGTVVGGVVVVSTTAGKSVVVLTSSETPPEEHPAKRSAPAASTAESRLTVGVYVGSGTRIATPEGLGYP